METFPVYILGDESELLVETYGNQKSMFGNFFVFLWIKKVINNDMFVYSGFFSDFLYRYFDISDTECSKETASGGKDFLEIVYLVLIESGFILVSRMDELYLYTVFIGFFAGNKTTGNIPDKLRFIERSGGIFLFFLFTDGDTAIFYETFREE